MKRDQHQESKKKKIAAALMVLTSLLFVFNGIVSPMLATRDRPSQAAAVEGVERMATGAQTRDSQDKSEVIYAKLNAKGEVAEAYVVNRFKPAHSPLKDYGDYSETKALTDKGSLRQAGDHYLIETGDSDFYYQGKLENKTLPWRFALTYLLDGQAMTPADLSGADGQLEINIEVAPNPQLADANPWADHNVLQLSLTLPGEVTDRLEVEGGSIAQAGSNQMANFLLFPGSTANSFKVKATVHDFHMPAMQIAGIPMNVDISVDDFLALSGDEDLQALQDGVSQLYQGSLDLADGLKQLKEGGQDLQKGLNELAKGGDELTKGGDTLAGGLNQFIDGVNQYTKGVSQAYQGSEQLVGAADQLAKGFSQLDGQPLLDSSAQIKGALDQIAAGLEALGSAEDIEALKQQLLALDQAATALSQGSTGIKQGIDELSAGIAGLAMAAEGLYNGLGGLILDMGSQADAPTDPDVIVQEAGLSPNARDNQDVQLLLNYTIAENQRQNTNKVRYLQTLKVLHNGADALNNGLNTMSQGLTDLQTNYAVFDANIQNFATMIPALAQMADLVELAGGLKTLADQYTLFDQGLRAYVGGVNAIREGFKSTQGQPDLYSGITGLRDGLKELDAGGKKLTEGAGELRKGLGEFIKGLKEYVSGVHKLKDGFSEYLDGVGQAADGSAQLADGLGQLNDGLANIDEQLKEKIDELLGQYQFDDAEPVSFASNKNQDVGQVQFVIMTEAVPEKEVPKEPIGQVETTGFWDRLFNLFR